MVSTQTINLIKKHEGLRLLVYKDIFGNDTIGYGHKLLPSENYPLGINITQADNLLMNDISIAEKQAEKLIANYEIINEVRQAVIIDMIFNLGMQGFSRFTDTIAALNIGNWTAASKAMENSLWYKQTKERAIEDCLLMSTGMWSTS